MTRRNTWESITSPCIFVKLTISSKPNIQTSPLVTQHFARWNHRMPFFSKTHHLTNADEKNMKTFFSSSLHSQDWLLQQFLGTMFMPGEFRRSCDFLLERYMFAMLQRAKDIIWQLWFARNREISRVDSWWWTNPTPRRKIHRRPQISLLVTFIRFSQLPKHQKDTGIKLWANQIKIWYCIDSDWLCKGILLWVPE